MRIFAISDLHMSTAKDKPMDIFGGSWDNYLELIFEDWNSKVLDDDVVLVGGDISWAMTLEDAKLDFEIINTLPGRKIFVRGNHDYWWSSVSKVRQAISSDDIALQNDSVKIGSNVICGTRGWTCPNNSSFTSEDEKIYKREVLRMELALADARKKLCEGDKFIVLMHFPPFNATRDDNDFTKLFHKNNVDKVVYGHLHGNNARCDLLLKYGSLEYYLTSCDRVGNKLIQIV